MAFYMDEEQAWKCRTHPSKRRRTGICPKCLHQRLLTLCPNCATALPCASCPPPPNSSASSSSSSSAASFSLFSFSRGGSRHAFGNGEPDRVTNNLDVDPALRKSRSVAISFLRSRSRYVGNGNGNKGCEIEIAAKDVKNDKLLPPKVSRSRGNFWSIFTVNKSKKCDVHADGGAEENSLNSCADLTDVDENSNSVMMRSRSVAVGAGNRITPATTKHKGWYFPSPINAFRHSKAPRSVTVA